MLKERKMNLGYLFFSIGYNVLQIYEVGDLKKLAWVHRIGSVIEAEVLNRLITPNFVYLLL